MRRGDVAKVKQLLQDETGATARDSRGRTPLHVAVHMGHTAVVNALLDWCYQQLLSSLAKDRDDDIIPIWKCFGQFLQITSDGDTRVCTLFVDGRVAGHLGDAVGLKTLSIHVCVCPHFGM